LIYILQGLNPSIYTHCAGPLNKVLQACSNTTKDCTLFSTKD